MIKAGDKKCKYKFNQKGLNLKKDFQIHLKTIGYFNHTFGIIVRSRKKVPNWTETAAEVIPFLCFASIMAKRIVIVVNEFFGVCQLLFLIG